jgi:hypothetical protein
MQSFTSTKFSSSILLLLAFTFVSFLNVTAQVVTQIGTGTQAPLTNNSIYSPICRFAATSGNDASRSNLLYTSTELNTAGIFTGATITKLAFYKIGTGATTAGFTFQIYMRNSTTTAPMATTTTWATITSTHTLQYNTTSQAISAATGWVEFTLDVPFTYTGDNVEIAFNHDMSTIVGDPTTGPFDWQYTTGFQDYIIGTVGTTPAGVATLSGTVANYKVRPNIQVTYISSTPCSGTPVPGTTTITPTLTCTNTQVTLGLTGNVQATGLTYTWQESATLNGTYTDISTASSSIAYTLTATTTKYYRAAVRCNGGAPENSVPALLTVNPAFPGGTYTINNASPTSGSNFNSFTDAFNAISCGVSGKVIFEVPSNQTFTENPPELNASGTVTDSIIFRKTGSGGNPVIQPATPGTIASSTTLGSNGDAVIIINGGDYISFEAIDINTATYTTGVELYEYGYYLKKKSATDACKHVRIKNAVITLAKGIYSFGIHVSNNSGTTAVTVTGAGGVSDDIRISGNTINDAYGGIYVRGDATAIYYDQNNSIGVDSANTINNFAGGASTAYGIYAIGQNNLKIANNIVMSVASGHTTTMYGIYTGTATNASTDIYNNIITISGGGTTTSIYGISNNAGATGTSNLIRIYNNKVTGCTYSTATTGALYLVEQAATGYNVEIYSNELTGNKTSPTTTGAFYMIYQSAAVVNQSKIYSNIINNNIKMTGTTGITYCIYNTGAATSNNLIYNNTITDVSVTNTSGSVTGIHVITGASNSVYNNRILSITNTATTTGALYGITLASGGVTNNVYNNIITGLAAPTSTNTGTTTTDHIRGINVTSTTASSTQNISFNTIYLNASGGAIFSTSCVFHTTNATATTSALYLRNNILVNHSTASGVGVTSALRLSSTTLTNYNAASNNNLLYVNSGATHFIFYDGTNGDPDAAAFKSRVAPRETSTVSENPAFVNNAVLPYDLHLNTGTPSQAESGGVSIGGITTDIDGDVRNASTPDIGADEFAGTAADLTGPSISYTALPVESICLGSKTLSVTITDASGINVTAGTKPRLWYKKANENDVLPANNTAASNGWKYVEATNAVSPFIFNFDFSLLNSALTYGDSVSYFVVAQDISPAVNVGVSVASFNSTPSSVALSSGVFPVSGNIKGFEVVTQPNPVAVKTDKAELCVSGTVTLNIDGINVTGATYQWQSSPQGLNTFTDIPGATTLPYTTASFNQSTDFRLAVQCNATPIASSPSPVLAVMVNNPQVTGTTPNYHCGPGTVTLQATPSAGASLNWYANSTGGISIGTGSSFVTPSITTSTTYYVSAGLGGTTQVSGHGNPTVTTATQNAGLFFDLNTEVILNSVDVYTNGTSGSVVIALYNTSGTLLYTSPTFNVPSGTLSTPYTLALGWAISAGTNYRIVAASHTPNLGYHTGSFPIQLGNGVGTVTVGAASGGGTTTLNYFIYNMNTTSGCNSNRTAVLATIDNNPGCTPFPVNLLSFKGEKSGSSNRLLWTTASEINNSGFELQRSIDGINFSKIAFIATKAVNGTNTGNLQYSYTDATPPAGIVYYRLKQIDKDGKYTHSSTVTLARDRGTDLRVLAVYPNPVTDVLNIKIETPQSKKTTLTVTDAAGRVVLQQQGSFTAGENFVQLPTQQLVRGTYFIKIIADCVTIGVYKFLKN